MSRYYGPRRRVMRRLRTALPGLSNYIPGSEEERKPYPPGQHGPKHRRLRLSDQAIRLREKQKLRYHYGLTENQLRRYFIRAHSGFGDPSQKLLSTLESRLDNVVFRLG